jgi:hypothetical protein
MQDQETWDHIPDPREGDATVDYRIWRYDRLVPAPPADVASIADDMTGVQEEQRPHGAVRHRASLRACNLRTARRLRLQRAMICAPRMGCPQLVIPWRRARHAQSRAGDKEGAYAKRSVAR